jgi:hypothetical protein
MICVLATMMSLLLVTDPPPKPAAMVLDLKGRVELKPVRGEVRPAKVCDLLYPGERLVIPVDGAATVAILVVGAQERLAGGSEATVGPRGCTPASAVAERREQRPTVARTMKSVRAVSGDGRKAVAPLRSGNDEPPAITPIQGATVSADRPGLAWPSAKGAKGYRVKLISGAGRELWRAESTAPKLTYPAYKEPLSLGYVYRWEVTDLDSHPVATGRFMVATESERKQMEELKSLAAGDDRADLLAAALSYRRLGCCAEATAAFERLVRLAPDEAVYREELAELYRQAGRSELLKAEQRGVAKDH